MISPPRFPLPFFVEKVSSFFSPFSFSSRREEKRCEIQRREFLFFLFCLRGRIRLGSEIIRARENISAADENNPPIDEIGVAIGGMLENIIGE